MTTRHPSYSYHVYASPLGPICLWTRDGGLARLAFGNAVDDSAQPKATACSNAAMTQVLEYLAGKRRCFDIPLNPEGSDFQKSVWQAIGTIPYAQTATCTDIARIIGSPTSYRLVGAAVKANPLPLILPDHRVVTAHGTALGTGIDASRRAHLLEFEKRHSHSS